MTSRYTRTTLVITETYEYVPSHPAPPTAGSPVVVDTSAEECPPSALRLRAAAPSRPTNIVPFARQLDSLARWVAR